MKQIIVLLLSLLLCVTAHAQDRTKKTLSSSKPKEPEKKAAPSVPDIHGRDITLRDFGSDDLGFLSLPNVPPKCGVLIIPGKYGMNDETKRFTEEMAKRGYVSIAVDLYNGQIPRDADAARELMRDFRDDAALRAVNAGITLLSESPQWKTDHIVIAAFGEYCYLPMELDRKLQERISGMVWFDPQGNMDERTFKRMNMPLEIIGSKENSNVTKITKLFDKERQKIMNTQLFQAPVGFVLEDEKGPKRAEAVLSAVAFWNDCADGKYKDERDFFTRWVDSIAN